MGCGEISFLEGGALKDVNIIGGKASGTALSECTATSTTVKNLKEIDTASVDKIVKQMAYLSSLDPGLARLIATSIAAYGQLDDAFICLISKALQQAEVKTEAAGRIAAAIADLPPATLTAFTSKIMSDGVAKEIGTAISKLSPESKKVLMSSFICSDVANIIISAISELPITTLQTVFNKILNDNIVDTIADKLARIGNARLTELFNEVFNTQMAAGIMNTVAQLPVSQLEDLAKALFTPDVCRIIVTNMCRLGSDSLKTFADILYSIAHHGCVPVPYPSCQPVPNCSCTPPPPMPSCEPTCADIALHSQLANEAESAIHSQTSDRATIATNAEMSNLAARVKSITEENIKDIVQTMSTMPKDVIRPLAEKIYHETHDDNWGECPNYNDVHCDCDKYPGNCAGFSSSSGIPKTNIDGGELP